MADGEVRINTSLNTSAARKQLAELVADIKRTESTLSDLSKQASAAEKAQASAAKEVTKAEQDKAAAEEKVNSILEQQAEIGERAKAIQQQLAAAEAEAAAAGQRWASGVVGADSEQARAIEQAAALRQQLEETYAEADKLNPAFMRANDALAAATSKADAAQAALNASKVRTGELNAELATTQAYLDSAKSKAGGLEQRLASAEHTQVAVTKVTKSAAVSMEKFGHRVGALAKRVFVFTLITSALRHLRSWLGNVLKSNEETAAAVSRLKGALMTLAAPILSVAVPALTTLIDALTRVIQVAAQVVAFIFGMTGKQASDAAESLHKEQKAISGVGGAASKASKSLAAFDEINRLSTEESGGGGGGGAAQAIEPKFGLGDMLDEDQMQKILSWVELIGSALAGWKIGSALGLGLKETLGLIGAIYSAIQFAKATFDAWTNGVTWETLQKQLLSLAGVAAGLYVAFGPVAAGIALVVGGLVMLATGFHDAMENGWSLENTLTAIAGLLMTGLGIGILTGSFIPLLLAGIAAVLLALTVATGHGGELIWGLRQILQGFKDFFVGIFTGDIDKACKGISEIFTGLQAIVMGIVRGIRDLFLSFLTWFDEKTNGIFHEDIENIKQFVNDVYLFVRDIVDTVVQFLKEAFTGITQFISGVLTGDWDMAFKGLVNVGISVLNLLIGAFEALTRVVAKAMNSLIESINGVIAGDLVKSALSLFGVDNWSGITFRFAEPTLPRIPLLAQGAVIPPNREFLAVLGDQTAGRNIEAPEGLLREIMGSQMQPLVALLQQLIEIEKDGRVMQVNDTVFARVVHSANKKESQRIGGSLINIGVGR